MEQHQPDPTSDGPTDPWDTVSAEFSSLGDRLGDIYRRIAAEGGPTEDEIRAALATLAGAWDQVSGSFSTALSDPETRAHVKKAAGSLAAALGATISGLGDELERNGGGPPDGED